MPLAIQKCKFISWS